MYEKDDSLHDTDADYDEEGIKVPYCGHKGFNSCKYCMTAYGKLMKRVENMKGVRIAHINVRSLYPKIDEIRFPLKCWSGSQALT